jgi:hypothetical protein
LYESIQVGDGFSDFPVDEENRRHGIYCVFKMVKKQGPRGPSGWENFFVKYNAEAEFEHGVQKGPVKFWIDERESSLIDKKLIFDETKPGRFELV